MTNEKIPQALDKLFTEKQVVEISGKVLSSIQEKIKDQISDKFFAETQHYFYQIYDNNKEKIETELINEITELYVKEPKNYKFTKLRHKLFEEHKIEILKSLTDGAIEDSIANIILEYTHKNSAFDWRWKEGITKFILKNWDKFKDDEIMIHGLGRDINRLQNKVVELENKLREVNNLINQ